MKVIVPINNDGKGSKDDFILDFNVVIVDIKERVGNKYSVREHNVDFGTKEMDIIYDVYLNNRRIRTDMKISRKYEFNQGYDEVLRDFKKLLHKQLLD